MTKAEQFFFDNAGYSVAQGETQEQGHERSAKQLAQAEAWAGENGYYFAVESDADADESFMDDEPQEYQDEWRGTAWWCAMYDSDDKLVDSLGGCFGHSDYKRVVKAELALEAMPALYHHRPGATIMPSTLAVIYEFTNDSAAHRFHAEAQAWAHQTDTAAPRWLGVIAGWSPETYRVEVSPEFDAARDSQGAPNA